MVIKIFFDSSACHFLLKFKFFSHFWKVFMFQVYGYLSQVNYFSLETGILDSLLRQ